MLHATARACREHAGAHKGQSSSAPLITIAQVQTHQLRHLAANDQEKQIMAKSIAYTTTALAGTILAMASPGRAEEPMRVSGTAITTQVESHFILGGDQVHGSGADKWVGAISAPGWFDSMQGVFTGSSQTDLKLGQSEARGSLLWRNSDGAVIGSYAVKAAFTMDQKTNMPKGSIEGTWEIRDGIDHFANVRGHGTVKGEFNGANEIDHWSGTITGFEKRPQ
jgi:hypothetical protein